MPNDQPAPLNTELQNTDIEDQSEIKTEIKPEMNTASPTTQKAESPGGNFSELLIDLVFSIIIPTLILKKLSGDDMLGATLALIVALSFPALAGVWGFYKKGKITFIPALGFISILLTGGIGILKLPKEYIAYKEALVPSILGLITIISAYTSKPIVKPFIMNDAVMNTEKIEHALQQNKTESAFNQTLVNATWIVAASFVFSAVANYLLAKWIVVSESGTDAFNSELGTITVYGYLMIGLPATVFTIGAAIYAFKGITKHTGLKFEELFREDL